LRRIEILALRLLAAQSLDPKVPPSTPPPPPGPRDRLAQLYNEYARFVAWFASRLLPRQDEVEDVVQEVFVIAAQCLDDLSDPPKIRGWLKTVTLRRAGRLLRWKRVRARFGIAPDARPIEEFVASPGASQEDRAALRELLLTLEGMPTDLRIAWSLRYMHEETIESVAALTGCSLATAKRRIAAAQRVFREELSDG
jgi:RNA polymerase sigma-70 factor (ECF subfamily)